MLFCKIFRHYNEETAGWYSLVIDVKCSWHTVADNMFSIINMIIIIIWQYSTYSCECVKRLFISLIKANCICSLYYWGWAGAAGDNKEIRGRGQGQEIRSQTDRDLQLNWAWFSWYASFLGTLITRILKRNNEEVWQVVYLRYSWEDWKLEPFL